MNQRFGPIVALTAMLVTTSLAQNPSAPIDRTFVHDTVESLATIIGRE